MTLVTQIVFIVGGCILFLSILQTMVTRKITERQGVLWLIPAVLIILGGAFPSITYCLAALFRVEYAPSIIFSLAIIFLYYISFKCFQALAVLTAKNQELAMQVSMLNHENEKLLKWMKEEKTRKGTIHEKNSVRH